jgi:biopolymer transport protein ExbD
MSMSLPTGRSDAEDEINSTINTTPLVDIMLVLLIIFLITIPVVIKSVPITLPIATNIVTITKPENITIAVDRNGDVFWNDAPVTSNAELLTMLQAEAVKVPQPEVHIRGDSDVRFESIGRVMVDLQRSAILKVGFITNPEPKVF